MRVRRGIRGLVAAAIAGAALIGATPSPAGLSLAPAYTDSVTNPVSGPIFVTAPPGDSSRLFVVERDGQIRVAVDGVMRDADFLDISSRVSTTGEAGLLSMAFAPDYATSRKFYVYFVDKSDGNIHVEQFLRSVTDPDVADPTATTPLLDVPHPGQTNHYGGQIAFGPDDKLYAGTGDGGGANDPSDNAQNPSSKLGKLLAIDTSSPPPAVANAAIGLRNPFRFSFDRTTGDLVLGDVGQAAWEEVDWVPFAQLPGTNFGWDCYEATHPLKSCPAGTYTMPVIEYANPNGGGSPPAAVTGGVVVRDPALTSVFGRYLYADFFAGQIHSAALATPVTDDREETELPVVKQLVAFGEDADARVYVVKLDGTGTNAVRQIVCNAPCDAPSNGGGGAGGATPPANQPPQDQPPAGDGAPVTPGAVPAASQDTTAPRLRVRLARRQDVLRRRVVRLSVACDENCIIRVTGQLRRTVAKRASARHARASALTMRSSLKRSADGKRVVFELRASARIRRALAKRGAIALSIRGRDAAGNLSTAARTVWVKR